MQAGITGATTYKLRDTGGGNIVGSGVSAYITTRTLKRRGKRPGS